MPVFIIDKLKPKNNGVFKLMDTLDINHKGYELEDWLDSLENKLEEVINQTPSDQKMIELENRDGHIMWKYTDEDDSAWRELIDLSDIGGGGGVPGVDSDEIYIGPTEPEDQSIKMWVDTSEDDEEGDVIEIPTKVSELENDMNYITITDLKEKLSISKSDNTLSIYYDNELISQTQL